MEKVARFSVSVNQKLLNEFDKAIKYAGYKKRSQAISDLIREFTLKKNVKEKEVTGTIRVLFENKISNKVSEIEHDYPCLIISSMKTYIDKNACLETIIVKGKKSRIQRLFDRFSLTAGVKDCKLNIHN